MGKRRVVMWVAAALVVGVLVWSYAFAEIRVKDLDNKECGAWGYQSADVNLDCQVDLNDFAELAAGWLTCTDPNDPYCVQP